jgi:hypothetical protein
MRRGRIERLADRAGLGDVDAVHGPRMGPLVGFVAGVAVSLAATALWLSFGAPRDTGPGRVIWPLVGLSLAAVCLGLAIATALDRGRRIAVCREGLLHVRRSRVEAVPWSAVRHLRRRARTVYELDADGGPSITWNEELRGHGELFDEIERRVTPLLLEWVRERLTAGDHVAFDGLVVTASGLTAEGSIDPLPWDQVESVTFSRLGEAQVLRRGHAEPWFAGLVPDQAVLRTLMHDLLARPAER